MNKNEVRVGDRLFCRKSSYSCWRNAKFNQISGLENALTSDGILDLNESPGRVGVLGSGYIATGCIYIE